MADEFSEGMYPQIAFAFAHPDEMMAVYQAVMHYKFDIGLDDAEVIAVDPGLGAVAERLVDAIVAQAHTGGNEAMARAMAEWREVQEGYRQVMLFRQLRARLEWWEDAGQDRRLSFIRAFFRPLRVPDALAVTLAGEC